MTKIKICGITNVLDALKAVELGADALGFIFCDLSSRCVDRETAREIVRALPPFVFKVGVFVDEKEDVVREIQDYCGLTNLQFHGDESPVYCARFNNVIKAFRVKDRAGLDVIMKYEPYVSGILLDTYREGLVGGTGEVFDLDLVRGVGFSRPLILAGGMTVENVVNAIDVVKPYAVDSASGTESSPGRKDHVKMKRLINIVKKR